jgi:phage baseplate assembly protein W
MANNLDAFDLRLSRWQATTFTSDRDLVDLQVTTSQDVATITGTSNLRQAIINRLFTRQGELAALGHPTYGSRLYQLIGELNNERTRILAEVYIRECLAQEARIEVLRHITCAPPSRGAQRHMLEVTIAVKPVGVEADLVVTLALNLAG